MPVEPSRGRRSCKHAASIFGGGVRSRVCAWLAYPCSPTCVYSPSPRHQPAIVGSRLYCCAAVLYHSTPYYISVLSRAPAEPRTRILHYLATLATGGGIPNYYHLKCTKVPGYAPVLYHSTHTTFLYCPERLRSLLQVFVPGRRPGPWKIDYRFLYRAGGQGLGKSTTGFCTGQAARALEKTTTGFCTGQAARALENRLQYLHREKSDGKHASR